VIDRTQIIGLARAVAASGVCRILSAFILLFAAITMALPIEGPGRIAASAPPGGAPLVGSGTMQSSVAVRVLDGNTIITWIHGKQVAVRFADIDVAPYTTPCGGAATKALWKLVAGGELSLEEDSALAFDANGLRLYYARTRDGRAVGQELVKAGVARSSGKADNRHRFAADEAQARDAGRGCLWDTSLTGGVVPAAQPSQAAPVPFSTVLPTGFSTQVVAAGIDQPTGFAFAPDGRIFITGKHGLVWVVKGGASCPHH